MKILFSADWHVKLTAKKVPKDWQKNRYSMLVSSLIKLYKEHSCDSLVIGGDFYDSASPTTEETGFGQVLLAELMEGCGGELIIYPGNHEIPPKTLGKSILADLIEPLKKSWKITLVEQFQSFDGFDVIPYTVLKNNKSWDKKNPIVFTHVRGNIGTLVDSEIPLENLSPWEMVIAGDLHDTKMSQLNILYPGSPVNTSFTRNERESGTCGVFIIDTVEKTAEWVDLAHLPQLIRKTVSNKSEIVKTDYDHTVYELEGDLAQLKQVDDNPLLDKTINVAKRTDAVIDMSGLSTTDKFIAYWSKVEKLDDELIKSLASKVAKHAVNSN